MVALAAPAAFRASAGIQVRKRALVNGLRDVTDPIPGAMENLWFDMAAGFQRVHVERHLHRTLAGPSGATSATHNVTAVVRMAAPASAHQQGYRSGKRRSQTVPIIQAGGIDRMFREVLEKQRPDVAGARKAGRK